MPFFGLDCSNAYELLDFHKLYSSLLDYPYFRRSLWRRPTVISWISMNNLLYHNLDSNQNFPWRANLITPLCIQKQSVWQDFIFLVPIPFYLRLPSSVIRCLASFPGVEPSSLDFQSSACPLCAVSAWRTLTNIHYQTITFPVSFVLGISNWTRLSVFSSYKDMDCFLNFQIFFNNFFIFGSTNFCRDFFPEPTDVFRPLPVDFGIFCISRFHNDPILVICWKSLRTFYVPSFTPTTYLLCGHRDWLLGTRGYQPSRR